MSGLAQIGQDDFGAGTLRGTAPDVQPGVGVHEALNALFNDDGDIVKRGGAGYATALLGAPLTWTWTGFLGGLPLRWAATADQILDYGGVTLGAPGIARPVLAAVLLDRYLYLPNGTVLDVQLAPPAVVAPWPRPAGLHATAPLHVAAVADRLVVAAANRIAFSEAGNPGSFIATDFHGLPGGVMVQGLYGLQDSLLVFTNYGLWVVSNMAYDLTDAAGNVQQTLALVAPELGLLHEAGLAPYAHGVIAPCIDRVYLVDGVNPPVPISDSIGELWDQLVDQGLLPGGAKVFRNTLFLPMLNAAGITQSLLTCRLNRPVRGRQVYYPWAEIDSLPRTVKHFDVSLVDPSPRLVGASQGGEIIDLTSLFDPHALTSEDAGDQPFPFAVETRDFPTGQGQPNHLKRVRVRYSLDGPATMNAYYRVKGGNDEDWHGLGSVVLSPGHGQTASWWLPDVRRARWVRVRIDVETDEGIANLVIHRIECSVRSATHGR